MTDNRTWAEHSGLPNVPPGLGQALQQVRDAMPAGLHPATITGFMSTKQPDLQFAGHAVTPMEWLELDQPVEPVLHLASCLGEFI